MSRSTRVVRRWLPGGWSLLGKRRGGTAQRDGLDDRGLVPIGRPGRAPIGVARPLVDPVDAGDHCSLAQARSTLMEPTLRLLIQAGPWKGRPFSTQSPTPLQRGAV